MKWVAAVKTPNGSVSMGVPRLIYLYVRTLLRTVVAGLTFSGILLMAGLVVLGILSKLDLIAPVPGNSSDPIQTQVLDLLKSVSLDVLFGLTLSWFLYMCVWVPLRATVEFGRLMIGLAAG